MQAHTPIVTHTRAHIGRPLLEFNGAATASVHWPSFNLWVNLPHDVFLQQIRPSVYRYSDL